MIFCATWSRRLPTADLALLLKAGTLPSPHRASIADLLLPPRSPILPIPDTVCSADVPDIHLARDRFYAVAYWNNEKALSSGNPMFQIWARTNYWDTATRLRSNVETHIEEVSLCRPQFAKQRLKTSPS